MLHLNKLLFMDYYVYTDFRSDWLFQSFKLMKQVRGKYIYFTSVARVGVTGESECRKISNFA